jgi:hypothetical protein
MPDNPLLESAIKYRLRLDKQSNADIQRLINAYTQLAARLMDKQDLFLLELGQGEWTVAQVRKMARYQTLISSITDELNRYNQYLAVELNSIANTAVSQAINDYRQLLYYAGGGIISSYNAIPNNAIKTLLGFLDSDSPLFKRLNELAPLLAQSIGDKILEGVGLGYNPMKVGAMITNELGWGLSDAMRWARTTQMWVYRSASQATMAANSDISDGWIWFAILDEAVPPCESCLANHGQLFPLDEILDDHWNGRCVALPHVKGDDNPVSQSGEEWFGTLDEAKQRDIMGVGKLEAYNEGKFNFSQLTQQVPDTVFGTMRTEVSLKDLLGE